LKKQTSYDTLGRKVGKTAQKVMKDNTLKEAKFKSANQNYNLKKQLLSENKINKDFLEKLNFITLEELITLKLLVASKSLRGKLCNFPLLKYSSDICKEAVVRYALSESKNIREASLILGIKKIDLQRYIKNYNIDF
jgi:hypothetical protein|tara:strand:+ start:168 stop:578 length:411 start_codon:yes stop_codon:yes gene_type:complete